MPKMGKNRKVRADQRRPHKRSRQGPWSIKAEDRPRRSNRLHRAAGERGSDAPPSRAVNSGTNLWGYPALPLAPYLDTVYGLLYPVTRPPDPVRRLVPAQARRWAGVPCKAKTPPRSTEAALRGPIGNATEVRPVNALSGRGFRPRPCIFRAVRRDTCP